MYEDMTFENIQDTMLSRIRNGVDKREGSIIYDSTAAIAYILAETYFKLENQIDLVLPDTSAGEYLDRFVSAFNVCRKVAVKAIRIGVMDKEVPIGSRFATSGDISLVYTAKELVKIENGNYIYHLECETPGKNGNKYFGRLIPAEYISGLGAAEIGDTVIPGTDEESDESLRERFFAKIQRPSTSGNVNDYYNWTMSCAGVGAVKVFPLAEGPGTVKLVIANSDKSAADAALLKNVSDFIEIVRPIGATVIVVSAVEKALNVSARILIASGANLGIVQTEFEEVLDKYLKNKAFNAEYISLARVGNLLMSVSGVEDYAELSINGGQSNILLEDEEIAVMGAIRLEVV